MHDTDEPQPMDPIALTLAVWLGIIVSVTGLMRLSQEAAVQAALAQPTTQTDLAQSQDETRPLPLRMIAFGG